MIFSPPLDLLLFLSVSTPILGWISYKAKAGIIAKIYPSVGLAAALYLTLLLLGGVMEGGAATIPSGGAFAAHLRIDTLGAAIATVFVSLGLAASIYSASYMKDDRSLPLYFTLLLSMISGMVGVAFAGDLFTLYVFWELMCIPSYILVAFTKGEGDAVEAAFKYLVMSSAGSATALLGISLLYGMAGTLEFSSLGAFFGGSQPSAWIYLATLLLASGFGVKAAIVPLHTWLPDAHSAAPSPISAMLSGVVIEAGIYVLCRLSFTAFIPVQGQVFSVLAILSIITMLVGNISPLMQNDLKRLLAFSSIAHIGYMLAGLAIGTELALTGTFLHVLNHAIMKGAAFLCAGAIIHRIGTRQMGEMGGIARKMPVTAIALSISLLALIGMPPLNGFISELTIVTASLESPYGWLGLAVIMNSILSSAYYLQVIRVILQPIKSERVEGAREAPLAMLVPIVLMAALIVILGLWPDFAMDVMRRSADSLMAMVQVVD
uniref:NADH-quinone oxidoreductase subunit M n=1 Tax=Candidatus Methanomethylicus mesodigestus TaxID=1867258 RepID=A0A7C3ERP2_9CREN